MTFNWIVRGSVFSVDLDTMYLIGRDDNLDQSDT